jgi:IS30 family transposase
MIRRFLPKGTSFKGLKQEDVKRIEKWINQYPRKIFKFKTSEEYYKEELKAA